MLGINYGEQPDTIEGRLLPIERFGIKCVSMGMLTHHDAPAILRGPMITKYMRLFIEGTVWGELDYLILDLPPGTGDIQLTLAQSIPLSGVVIVTTPQDVSLNIARRGLRMFEKVNVPILGIIENMSGFECPHCHTNTPIFQTGGAERLSHELHVPLLGSIPLEPQIVAGGDTGRPLVVEHPDAMATQKYRDIALQLQKFLALDAEYSMPAFKWLWETDENRPSWNTQWVNPQTTTPGVAIGFRKRDPRTLSVLWQDGRQDDFDARDLRLVCPCAMCVDEMSGKRTLDPNKIPLDVGFKTIANVGRYALSVSFTDGHSTGIFSFERLRRQGDKASKGFEV
jgi:ATP-binding protein involved in chromosome partitioning